MKKTKKALSSIGLTLFALGLSAPVMVPTQAEASSVDKIVDSQGSGVMRKSSTQKSIKTDANGERYYTPEGEFESVNAVDANNWAKRKGKDAVGFFTTLAQPLAVVIFIISGIMLAVGGIAKNDWFKRGVLGMTLAIVMWTAVVFAPELIQFFSEWLAS